MRKTLSFLLLALCTLAHAQHAVVLNFNLKNTRDNDTLTLSWGANNKSVTPLITTLLAYKPQEVTLPLNEPRVVVLGIKGQSSTLELLLSPPFAPLYSPPSPTCPTSVIHLCVSLCF